MTEVWMLVIMYGLTVSATTAGTGSTVVGPYHIAQVGPMDLETCKKAAISLNENPSFQAGCQSGNANTMTYYVMPPH